MVSRFLNETQPFSIAFLLLSVTIKVVLFLAFHVIFVLKLQSYVQFGEGLLPSVSEGQSSVWL